MGDLLAQAPNIGVGAALVIVIGYLLLANRKDRNQHETLVRALVTRYDQRVEKLEDRINDLEREVDDERDKRRASEDLADQAARDAATALAHRQRQWGPGEHRSGPGATGLILGTTGAPPALDEDEEDPDWGWPRDPGPGHRHRRPDEDQPTP